MKKNISSLALPIIFDKINFFMEFQRIYRQLSKIILTSKFISMKIESSKYWKMKSSELNFAKTNDFTKPNWNGFQLLDANLFSFLNFLVEFSINFLFFSIFSVHVSRISSIPYVSCRIHLNLLYFYSFELAWQLSLLILIFRWSFLHFFSENGRHYFIIKPFLHLFARINWLAYRILFIRTR